MLELIMLGIWITIYTKKYWIKKYGRHLKVYLLIIALFVVVTHFVLMYSDFLYIYNIGSKILALFFAWFYCSMLSLLIYYQMPIHENDRKKMIDFGNNFLKKHPSLTKIFC